MWKSQTLLLILCTLALIAGTADAQVRRYDPASGLSVPVGPDGARRHRGQTDGTTQIQSLSQGETAETEATGTAPPDSEAFQILQQQRHLNNDGTTDETVLRAYLEKKRAEETGPAGRAMIFADVDHFSDSLVAYIKEIKNTRGLVTELYMKDRANPFSYMQLLQKGMDKMEEDVPFSVDSGDKIAGRFRVQRYPTLVYIAPDGDRRNFDLAGGIGPFLTHLNRVRRGQR